jgi:prepilin-type N-terminal cleavage/methylation domain-containing protein/prepilin-type processing-associated H-X9-DG protein
MRMRKLTRGIDGSQKGGGGFTLIELLVVIAIIAILASLLLPALSRAKQQATGTQCIANEKQLTLAWNSYTQDNKGHFPADEEGDFTAADMAQHVLCKPWVNGWLTYSGGTDGTDTNTAFLVSGVYTSMGPYCGSPGIFKCPADPSCSNGRTGEPRVRSVSMNQSIGIDIDGTTTSIGDWLGGGNNGPGPYKIYVTESDYGRPSPANLWLFIDEHPDSINDGAFAVEEIDITDDSATWVDHASCLHDGACGFSFCDGHAVIHKWSCSTWKSTLNYLPTFVQYSFGNPNPVTGFANTGDLRWIAGHTTAKKDPSADLGFTMVPD